eukprot:NODE_1499_length_2457_cov_5.539056.p1 GENE.NODE_1499_length_2457_cov_5.539056~~NODE_1499_length_2457_cov_5.539056.p1  ORF type:complete len:724 (+),score=117.85 NODE_1499_length_2457_cov_5.539056:2-2173(+)
MGGAYGPRGGKRPWVTMVTPWLEGLINTVTKLVCNPQAAAPTHGTETCESDVESACTSRYRSEQVEGLGWFQRALDAMWPELRGYVESELLKRTLEPTLPGLCFAEMNLGDRAPRLRNVRCLVCSPRKHQHYHPQLQLVFHIAFVPKSANIAVGFGPLRAPISELSFEGSLCVRLVGFVPRAPVISGLKLFFANAPQISLAVTGISALPITPERLRAHIRRTISSAMVLPNAMNIHLDSIHKAFAEPDFLDYCSLHAIPVEALFTVAVLSVEGPIPELLHKRHRRGGPLSLGTSTTKHCIYVVLRVGNVAAQTDAAPLTVITSAQQGLRIGMNTPHRFLVDSLMDQELEVELYAQDSSILLASDQRLFQASVPIAALAQGFSEDLLRPGRPLDSLPEVRVPLHSVNWTGTPSAEVHNRMAVVLTGSLRPLAAVRDPMCSMAQPEGLLMVAIDCAVNLRGTFAGRRLFVRAQVQSAASAGPADSTIFGVVAQTKSVIATRGQAAATRAQNPNSLPVHPMRWDEMKAQLSLLLRRGVRLSPNEVVWILGANISEMEAQELLAEVDQEITATPKAIVMEPASDYAPDIEVLFQQELRLEVRDVETEGLLVELVDEESGVVIGAVAWSSLAWLSKCRHMQEDVHAYAMHDAGDALHNAADGCLEKLYLRRTLRFIEPAAEWDEIRGNLPWVVHTGKSNGEDVAAAARHRSRGSYPPDRMNAISRSGV